MGHDDFVRERRSVAAHSCTAKKAVTLPLSTDGVGIQNVTRVFPAAQWASWADVLEMIRQRHPRVVAEIITAFDQDHSSPSTTVVRIPRSGWKRPVSRCQVGRCWRKIVDTAHQGWEHPASAVLEVWM